MKMFLSRVAFAPLIAVIVLPVHAEDRALIGTSGNVDDHQGHSEQIEQHEGKSGQVADHQGSSRSVDDVTSTSEAISEHESTSETLDGRIAQPESLGSTDPNPTTDLDSLAAARAKLRAARESHAQREQAAPQQPAALQGSASASSEAPAADDAEWTSRLDIARKQIEVARASAAVWDESYADMVRDNYPRGDERQQLIDSREQAHAHVAAEEAKLPKLIEEARRAGVSPGVLDLQAGE